ncbi:transcriptional regulator GutM [Tessaracoccus palaemonis]|uniref:Transcriptional regulator GutM n=1 Tax=Tessaracoccus palaemonis TaxID=2829499 RepID=A0ABX8SJB2_9ACTN|nr:transcriptional regulator GutM [Tessaracoccus palaemonis]QXT63446.1 transcriptional regulator GutM [Tessaracoccus palaemonis]
MFWIFIIAIGIAWVAQSFLSFRQTQAFSQLFIALRRRGRVAMGKFRGGLVAGSIVLFLLDDDDRIVEAHRLGGVTVLARFKALAGFDGEHMGSIDPARVRALGKPTLRAVANAVDNFRIITAGGRAPEPPTALARLLDRLPGVNRKPKTMADPLAAISRRATPPAPLPATAPTTVVSAQPSRWRRRVTTT